MDNIKKGITLVALVVIGIACITIALVIPTLAPILAPLGGILLSGAFGMFQSVITPTHDKKDNNPGQNDTQETHAQNVHVDHNITITNSPVILFLYDKHRENKAIKSDSPSPRPLNLI